MRKVQGNVEIGKREKYDGNVSKNVPNAPEKSYATSCQEQLEKDLNVLGSKGIMARSIDFTNMLKRKIAYFYGRFTFRYEFYNRFGG